MKPLNPEIKCKDGATLSVQASEYHYCVPRVDKSLYSHVEVGFPSVEPTEFLSYAEEAEKPLDTVYGYVPVEMVNQFIENHGGILKGEMP